MAYTESWKMCIAAVNNSEDSMLPISYRVFYEMSNMGSYFE
jgi:hypothetical protein